MVGIAVVLGGNTIKGNTSNKIFPPLFPECSLNKLRALMMSDDLKWKKTRDKLHSLGFGDSRYSMRSRNIPAWGGPTRIIKVMPVIVESIRKSLWVFDVKSAQIHL